jgi:serine/threonine protein kinase
MTEKELERFRRAEAVFDSVLEVPPGMERDALLGEQCQGDPEMLEEVRQLIEDHESVRAAAPAPPATLPQFGPWQAVRLLGRGGMGTVYLAERADGAFRMSAAVKVVPLALASVDIEERFRRERQFLASLDHPKVARLIDGGVTGAGLPYLVMEFVDGLAIDRYCDEKHLDLKARIGLIRQVLEALAYVHACQVIHRDLKPSNILVDAQGNVKLLDFGTARLVDASGDSAITRTGVFAFTPESASPEQAQGQHVTFASDIYSAGVLLYRLTTGRPPYRFSDYSPAAVARRISETEPEPSGLDQPLDAIVSVAMRKNPQERYQSALEMDADLALYMRGEPVHARRPRKPRNIAIAAAVVALFAAAAWTFLNRSQASGQASIAVLPFASLSPQSNYLSNGLTDEITDSLSRLKTLRVIARPSVAQFSGKQADFRKAGRMLNVTEVLEGTVAQAGGHIRIGAKLERVSDGAVLWSDTYNTTREDLSAVQSELTRAVARKLNLAPVPSAVHVPPAEAHDYLMKGIYEAQKLTPEALAAAEADFERAIDLDPQYARAYLQLGLEKYNESVAKGSAFTSRTEAERLSLEQLIRKSLALDPNQPTAHATLAMIAMQYEWDWDRAETELRLGSAGRPSAMVEQVYAMLLLYRGHSAEADDHIRRAQDLDPFQISTMYNVAVMRFLEGRFDECRASAEKLAADSPRMFAAKALIGGCDIAAGRTDPALQEIRQWKQDFAGAQMFEAMGQAKAGHKEEALRLIRPFLEKYPNPGVGLQWFALVYALMGDEENAMKWLERSADQHEWQALNLAVNPVFAPMRHSTQFQALEKRMGLLP